MSNLIKFEAYTCEFDKLQSQPVYLSNFERLTFEEFDAVKSTNDDMKVDGFNDQYDRIVKEMIITSDDGSKCRECQYAGKRGHVKEHVEKHIHGFEFQCNECERTFNRKYSLRKHRQLHFKRG